MYKYILGSIAALALMTSFNSHASFVNSDLSTGDGLTVTDTINGNVWLDLSQTAGLTIQGFNDLANSTYAGWRLASSAEVLDMFQRLFPGLGLTATYTYINPVSSTDYNTFTGLFGITQSGSTTYSMGLFMHDNMVTRSGFHSSTYARLTNFMGVSSDLTAGGPQDGVYLIQDNAGSPVADVSLAGAGLISLLGFAGLARRKRTSGNRSA